MHQQLHVYANQVIEWFVAANEADLMQQVSEHRKITGEPADDFEDEMWDIEPDDHDLWVWLDPVTLEPSCPCDGAMLVIGSCEAWADAYGPGFLCTSEY